MINMSPKRTLMVIAAILIGIVLGGCSVNPTYTVHVVNNSTKSINARIEHERRFDSAVLLGSITVQPGHEQTLGPVESPPLERVVLQIGEAGATVATPESFVIKRGTYTAQVTKGTTTSWTAFEVSLTKE